VQKRGRLIVGVKDNLPPLGFRDASGNLVGFEIDIARELAKELLGDDRQVELVALKNRDRLPAIWEDRVDLVIAQLTLTNNRTRLVDFTLPYYTDGAVLVARRGTTLADLQQSAAIAVLKDSSTIAVLQYKLPQAKTIGVDSYQEGLAALQAGRVQAFAGDGSAIRQWLKANPAYEQVGAHLSAHSLAIALPRGVQYVELRDRVFRIVQKWRKNGWLRDRATYWGLP
jgi:polar amino acid transport system substrate-binding protein